MLYSNKDLRKLIIPLIFEHLLALLVGLADSIMVSSVGEAAVSAVSLVDTINILVINIFNALGAAGAVVVGHYIGAKNKDDAGIAAWETNYFSALLGIFATVVFICFHDGILHLIFGQVDADVMINAKSYLVITALSIAPIGIYNACAGMFRAMGDSKTTLYISIIMNVVNVIGNAILIYGANLGTVGAAIATTFSRTLAAVIIFCLLFQKKRMIHLNGYISWRFHKKVIKNILTIGIPNGVENSLFQVGKIVTISMVSTFGTASIAANAVCNTLAGFNMLPCNAINNAILAIVSVCVGAGEMEQARSYAKKLMKWSNITLACLSVGMVFLAGPLVGIYDLSSEALILAKDVLRFHAVLAVFFWIPSFSLPTVFRAAGDVVVPMIIALFSMWVFRIGMSYFLGVYLGIGLLGIWAAMIIDWVFRALCYAIRFRGKQWESYCESK